MDFEWLGVIMNLFTKRKCKQCNKHNLLRTSNFGYWVLACDEMDKPITVSKSYGKLDYTAPKWCPKKWRNR